MRSRSDFRIVGPEAHLRSLGLDPLDVVADGGDSTFHHLLGSGQTHARLGMRVHPVEPALQVLEDGLGVLVAMCCRVARQPFRVDRWELPPESRRRHDVFGVGADDAVCVHQRDLHRAVTGVVEPAVPQHCVCDAVDVVGREVLQRKPCRQHREDELVGHILLAHAELLLEDAIGVVAQPCCSRQSPGPLVFGDEQGDLRHLERVVEVMPGSRHAHLVVGLLDGLGHLRKKLASAEHPILPSWA